MSRPDGLGSPPALARPPLAHLATRGALWTGVAHGTVFALGVVKTIILARLVPREYFGLLAGAMVWTSYLSLARLDLRLAVYWFGAAGAAAVASMTSLVGVVAVERRVARCLGYSGGALYLRPSAAALAAGAATALLAPVLPSGVWLAALARGSVTVLCFAAILWTFDRSAARETWRTVRRGLARA